MAKKAKAVEESKELQSDVEDIIDPVDLIRLKFASLGADFFWALEELRVLAEDKEESKALVGIAWNGITRANNAIKTILDMIK